MLFTLYMYILHSKPKHCRNKKENPFTGKKKEQREGGGAGREESQRGGE